VLVLSGTGNHHVEREHINDPTDIPLGNKIYAIRAPAATSSPSILALERSVGIAFNWDKAVGFRRAGDNACAFTFRVGIQGTYGSLESALVAATEFMNSPSLHEGPLLHELHEECLRGWGSQFTGKLSVTSKFVVASILTSLIVFATFSTVVYAQEKMGCVHQPGTTYSYAMFQSVHPVCSNLLMLQLHVQNNAVEYVNTFFTQVKIGFVLMLKHIVDEMFY
jgi:hypothetical protein